MKYTSNESDVVTNVNISGEFYNESVIKEFSNGMFVIYLRSIQSKIIYFLNFFL